MMRHSNNAEIDIDSTTAKVELTSPVTLIVDASNKKPNLAIPHSLHAGKTLAYAMITTYALKTSAILNSDVSIEASFAMTSILAPQTDVILFWVVCILLEFAMTTLSAQKTHVISLPDCALTFMTEPWINAVGHQSLVRIAQIVNNGELCSTSPRSAWLLSAILAWVHAKLFHRISKIVPGAQSNASQSINVIMLSANSMNKLGTTSVFTGTEVATTTTLAQGIGANPTWDVATLTSALTPPYVPLMMIVLDMESARTLQEDA